MVSVIAPTNAVSRFAMPFFHRPIGSSIRKYSRSSRALRRDIGSILVAVTTFDFGTCPETGYRDAGEAFQCLDCAATGPANDVCT